MFEESDQAGFINSILPYKSEEFNKLLMSNNDIKETQSAQFIIFDVSDDKEN